MIITKNNKGRGANQNETSRFHKEKQIADLSDFGYIDDEDLPSVSTKYFTDHSKTILSKNDSPDIGFTYSINPYRGCEHGCAYCYARPTHEYLGLSAGLDFESKIFVKERAAELFRQWLARDAWQPGMICFSGITDDYQPAGARYPLTRACLEVALEAPQPIGIITKNRLVTRDL